MKRLLLAGLLLAASWGALAQNGWPAWTNKSRAITSMTGILAPANGGSGVANSKNLTWSNSLTLAGTDTTTMTFPTTSATIARTDAAQTFSGIQTFSVVVTNTGPVITGDATHWASVNWQANGVSKGLIGASASAGDIVGDSAAGETVMRALANNLRFTVDGTNSQMAVLTTGIMTSTGSVANQMRTKQTTVPTCTTNCGSGSPTIVGTDTAGILTLGTTPASAFQINFNGTWASAPACVVQMYLAGMVVGKQPLTVATTTTTLIVVTNGTAPATGDKYVYHCIGVS